MTNQERSEKIVIQFIEWSKLSTYPHVNVGIDFVTSQLDEAQLEVLEQNEVLVKIRIDEAVKDAIAGTITLELHQKIVLDRKAYVQEKAAMIADEFKYDVAMKIAERIRTMEADK